MCRKGFRVAASDKQAFLTALVQEHGQRLRRYLATRLRSAAADVPDLAQRASN